VFHGGTRGDAACDPSTSLVPPLLHVPGIGVFSHYYSNVSALFQFQRTLFVTEPPN